MKRILVIFLVIFSVMVLSSCSSEKWKSDDERKNARVEDILEAIKNKDKDALRSMFSEKALREAVDFDGSVEKLFSALEGEADSWEMKDGGGSSSSEDGDVTKMLSSYCYVTWDGERYFFLMDDYTVNSQEPNNLGLSLLLVVREEDESKIYDDTQKILFDGDKKLTHTGVYIPIDLKPEALPNSLIQETNDKENIVIENTVPEKTDLEQRDIEWGFGIEDIAIDSRILINLSYEDVVKDYGEPIDIETYKIPLLSAGEDYYRYFSVAIYENIEFEFYSEEHPMNDKIPSDEKVFRFDLTGKGMMLDCGLEVGMTVEEVVKEFGQREIYNIIDEESIKNVLENNKPDFYYSEYTQAMTILCDTEKFEEPPLAMSLVLLLKDNIVERIVFGYPTLD